MCVMSVISNYGQQMPNGFWNQQTWPPFRDLLDQAERVDRDLQQPDCVAPEKERWVQEIEERVRRLEAAVIHATGASAPQAV